MDVLNLKTDNSKIAGNMNMIPKISPFTRTRLLIIT